MLTLDPSNPVVAAIGRGVRAEMTGDRPAALAAYLEAWNAATDDFERCMAAHYVPRMLDDRAEKLKWNEDALRYAVTVGDSRMSGFFASLHACVGQARLDFGDFVGARDAFRQADASLSAVPAGAYKDGLAKMIAAGAKACG